MSAMINVSSSELSCRLCGAATSKAFCGRILEKYEISYFECDRCHSLQTERPYWLSEAYSGHHLATADTGAVMRGLNCQAILYAVARVLRFGRSARILDFGGGNGLLCRLLRDCGFEAEVADAYAINDFAQGFEDDGEPFPIICAFEVAEHFSNPMEDMSHIFGRNPALVCLGTETYNGQDPSWWYLSPASGQHLFFYSHDGMASLASRYGYSYFRTGNIHLFLNRLFTRAETALLGYFLRDRRLKWTRAYLALRASFAQAQRDVAALATR